MATIPPPVDQSGNITLPRRGGVVIPVRMTNPDGSQIDLSGMSLLFSSDRLEKMLVNDPDFDGGKLLIITEAEAQQFSSRQMQFSVLDQTSRPDMPIEVWPGFIRRGEL